MTLVLTACGTGDKAPTTVQNVSAYTTDASTVPDTIVQYLIGSSISDFKAEGSPTAIDFRNARVGYLSVPEKSRT